MQPSHSNYQSGTSGGNAETVGHCAVCNRPIAHGQTYYYCRLCGRGPLCNNHFYGDSGCAFCRAKKGFPGWAAALIVIAVLLIVGGLGAVYWISSSSHTYYPPPPSPSQPQTTPPATTTYYSLSTSVSPSGSGSVSPSGGSYTSGTVITLKATPSSGYVFDYWGGNASGSSRSTSVAMSSNKHVIAYFTIKSPTPTDTQKPTISNVMGSTTETTATITWTTDELASSQVEYGTRSGHKALSLLQDDPTSGSAGVLDHAVTLSGLESDTCYFYSVRSKDAAGNEAVLSVWRRFGTGPVASLPLSQYVDLTPWNEGQAFPSPLFSAITEGCFHRSAALALREGQTLKLTLESDCPIDWEGQSEDPRPEIVVWFSEMSDYDEERGGWFIARSWTKEIKQLLSFDEGKRLEIVLSPAGIQGAYGLEPPGTGIYKLQAVNMDPDNSHYLKYTIALYFE